ncbi:MAG: ribonuclease Z [Candidatus Omnitrophica bacterium]|nr:ribonuclease Z [Candidatus Omnitrophota bacterium]
MAKIIFLGTAAAVASGKRDNTSLLLIQDSEKILIDAPGSLLVKLAKLNPVRKNFSNGVNIDYRQISNIILTHSHPDHIYGLASFLHSRYKLKGHEQINIFAHTKTIELVKKIRKIFRLEDENKFPKLIYHKIKLTSDSPFYNSNNIKIWPIKVKHSKDSIGLKILFKKDKISCIYSGDTTKSQELIASAIGCDYLIHDCTAPSKYFKKYPQLNEEHTSSLTLGKIAKIIIPMVLIPIHFCSEVKYSFDIIRKEIRKNFKGEIIIPKDLQVLKLTSQPV